MPRPPGRIAFATAGPLHVVLEVVPLEAGMSGTGIALPGRRVPLIPAEARELAAELVDGADELEPQFEDEFARLAFNIGQTFGRAGWAKFPELRASILRLLDSLDPPPLDATPGENRDEARARFNARSMQIRELEQRGLLLSDTEPCLQCGRVLSEHDGGMCRPRGVLNAIVTRRLADELVELVAERCQGDSGAAARVLLDSACIVAAAAGKSARAMLHEFQEGATKLLDGYEQEAERVRRKRS